MVKVLLKSKTETFASTTVPALLIEISKYLNLDVNRICLKNSSNKTLTAADSFSQNDTLTLKDFGPQISWKLVFVLEYLGPILIHAGAYYYFAPDSQRAKLFLILNLMHYLKREYETLKENTITKLKSQMVISESDVKTTIENVIMKIENDECDKYNFVKLQSLYESL